MKKSILVVVALFIVSSVFSQNRKGIIYDYKKNQATLAVGSSGNLELGYFRRFTKNFSLGLSLGRAVSSKNTVTSGGPGLYLDMQDSYGDGWNGASIDFYVNGDYIANYTVYFSNYDVSLASYLSPGDSYSFSYEDGDYPDEVSYQISNSDGILYEGDGYDEGTVHSGVYNPSNPIEVTERNVVVPLFIDLKYNLFVKKRLQPSIIISPGVNLSEFDGLIRYGIGLDYHIKSDDHVITAMGNYFNYDFDPFTSFTLRYSYKF